MNFLPKAEKQKERYKVINRFIIVLLLIQLPIFILYGVYYPLKQLQEEQMQLQVIKEQLIDPKYEVVLQKLEYLERLNQEPKQTVRTQWISKSLVNQLFKALPKETTITTLEMIEEQNQYQIVIKGQAKKVEAILGFQHQLEQLFERDDVISSFELSQSIYHYEMRIESEALIALGVIQ